MRLGVLAVGLTAACGRVRFESLAQPTNDAMTRDMLDVQPDTPADAQAAICDWSQGPRPAGPPELVTSLMIGAGEVDPAMVPGDPNTMYFSSSRDGTFDIFVTHRAALTPTGWDPPQKVTELNTTTEDEDALVLDRGALHGYVDMSSGGDPNLYEIARATTGDSFAVVRPLTELNTAGYEYDPWPTSDELHLYFTRGTTSFDIYVASRSSTTSLWGNVQAAAFDTANTDAQATLTADQRLVVWSTQGATTQDLFYATRASPTDAWGPAQKLDLSPGTNHYEPYVREDGCELFFTMGPGGANFSHIYGVEFLP